MFKITKNVVTMNANILAYPDGYECIAMYADLSTGGANEALAAKCTTVNERTILPAGTVFPANDATAIGVTLNDYDVTDEKQVNLAILIRGTVLGSALPVALDTTAKAVLPNIIVVPAVE